MEKDLKTKVLDHLKKGMMFDAFTAQEFDEIKKCFEKQSTSPPSAPLPTLIDSQSAMKHLHCDKHRLNEYLNKGYLKRIKLGHRKIMIDHDSLRQFMTYGIEAPRQSQGGVA